MSLLLVEVVAWRRGGHYSEFPIRHNLQSAATRHDPGEQSIHIHVIEIIALLEVCNICNAVASFCTCNLLIYYNKIFY